MTQFREVCLAPWRMKFARQDTLGRQTEDFSEKINFRKKIILVWIAQNELIISNLNFQDEN